MQRIYQMIPSTCFLNIKTMNIISSYDKDEITLFKDVCEKVDKMVIYIF